jgi:hypothetical protein
MDRSRYRLGFADIAIPESEMIRRFLFVLPPLAVCAVAGAALADPPVAATIPQPVQATIPQPVAATIPQPAPAGTNVSQATVNGVASGGNYGAMADTKMICKTETPVGSRLGGHRVCMTKADWEKQSRSVQDYMNSRPGQATSVK